MGETVVLSNPARCYEAKGNEEFRNSGYQFDKALEVMCSTEGISLRIVRGVEAQMAGWEVLYFLDKEVYTIQNDGVVAQWKFLGSVS